MHKKIIPSMLQKLLTGCLVIGITATSANASVITESKTAGTSLAATFGNYAIEGQSVTTPTGGPWNNISFNFYDSSSQPLAYGNLFLFSQTYSGIPLDLGGSPAPGFVASASASGSGIWNFAPDVTLAAATQYFFYVNNFAPGEFSASYDAYAGGTRFFIDDNAFPFENDSDIDIDFTLSGTPIAAQVPEPGTIPLIGIALAGLFAMRKRIRPGNQLQPQ